MPTFILAQTVQIFHPLRQKYATIVSNMSGRVMIVGTGNVGASIAFAMLNQRTPVEELILTDIDTADAEGEVLDLSDALAVGPSWLKIRVGDYHDAANCDICILTAGANQKPGETRIDLLQKNARITNEIVDQIMASGFDGIFIVVANPMDTLSYLTWQYSGLPSERVIGTGTVLDSARLRLQIARELDVHPKSVHAYQIGEHGDSEFSLWSSANVGGEPLTQLLSQSKRNEIEDFARTEAYEIIEKKGATHYGIGACTVHIINCILGDERRILPVSTLDDCNDVYYGFPAVIGKSGVIRRLELKLTEEEGIKLQQSINIIKNTLKSIKE